MYSHQSSKCMFTEAPCFNFARCVFFYVCSVHLVWLFHGNRLQVFIRVKCGFMFAANWIPLQHRFGEHNQNQNSETIQKIHSGYFFWFLGTPCLYIYIRYKLRMLFVCIVFYVDAQVQSLFVFGKFVKGLSLSLILADESSSQVHLDACFFNPGAIFSMPLLLLLRVELNFSTNFPLLIRFNRTNNLRQYATHTWNYCQ